ncbi:glycosyl transferase family 39 [Hydrogenimonas sp.]|nr:glycosyl transferase family 39 [Hydrogenimonas sp.]
MSPKTPDYDPLIERYGLFVLTVVVYLSFFFNLGPVPLFDLDEGAFSEATREMLASGNYITTYLGGDLRFDKPILIYWLQAASVKLFGLNEFALRLPSALAATAWAALLYLFTKRLFDAKTALLATLFMVSALQISVIAKAAIADALLNLWIAASMFSILLYIKSDEKRWLYAAFAAIGFGMLTKGPVAVMIPVAVTFLYFLFKRDLKRWAVSVFNPVGILIFLAVALPWYLLEYMDQGMKFIEGFFFKHNLSRFENSFEGHSGSIFYYIPVLLVGTMPFTGVLTAAIIRIKEWISNDTTLFLVLWFGFVFIFFSFSGTKLPHYVIYGYTPLFIIMALQFSSIKSPLWIVLPPAVLMLVLIFLPEIANAALPSVKDPYAKALIEESGSLFGWRYKMEIALLLAALVVAWRMIEGKLAKSLVTGAVTLLLVNGTILPTYAALAQQPIKEAALFAKKHRLDVVMWGINVPSFMVYSEKIVPRRDPEPGEIVLTKITKLKEVESYQSIFKKYGIVLVRIDSMKKGKE